MAFEALKWAGALYLLWLAWEAVKPGARSPFEAQVLPTDPPRKLFLMGFVTNLLNPKVAFFYMALFPQFIDPERGSVLLQSLVLGTAQMTVSFTYVMGGVLAALAVRLALESRPDASP